VFSALVIGVYELGRGHDLAGVASRTLAFTVILSTMSVVIGIALVDLIRPGEAFQLSVPEAGGPGGVEAIEASAAAVKPLSQILVELIPRNPIDSAVRALDGEPGAPRGVDHGNTG